MADKIKMLLALVILGAGITGFYYFADEHTVLRVVGVLVMAIVAMIVALQTTSGRSAWAFIQDSRVEVRKVVWPTRKETVQMTLTVIAMTIVVALILWGFDSFLAWLVQKLIG